jgi:predicted kinase
VERAQATRIPAIAIVLALPPGVVHARNAARTERVVDSSVVERHLARMAVALGDGGIGTEGFAAVHVLGSVEEIVNAVIQRPRRGVEPV